MTHPLHERQDEIVTAYAKGKKIETIARRFDLRPSDVERIVAAAGPLSARKIAWGTVIWAALALVTIAWLAYNILTP